VRVCRKGVRAHGDSSRGYFALGRALLALGKLATAKQALLRAIELDPGDRATMALLTDLLIRREEWASALELLHQACDQWEDDAHFTQLANQVRQHVADAAAAADDAETPQVQRVGSSPRPPAIGQSATSWGDVRSEWDALLESSERLPTEPDAEVPARLVSSPAIDVGLPPLTDPVARGMPPLPESEELEWEVHRARAAYEDEPRASGALVPARNDAEPETVQALVGATLVGETYDAEVQTVRASPEEIHRLLVGTGGDTVVAAAEAPDDAASEAEQAATPTTSPSVSAPDDAPSQAPAESRSPAAAPVPGREQHDLAGFRETVPVPAEAALRVEAAPAPHVNRPPTSEIRRGWVSEATQGPELGPMRTGADLVVGGMEPITFTSTVGFERKRPSIALLIVFLLVVFLGAGGLVWLYLADEAVNEALSTSRSARLSGQPSRMDAARGELQAARGYYRGRQRLTREEQLLADTRALLNALPLASAAPSTDEDSVAEAIRALRTGDFQQATAVLARLDAQHPQQRRFLRLLKAWSAWGQGKTEAALRLLQREEVGDADKVGDWGALLEGYVRFERGELESAERALRRALKVAPDWDLPRLALAAVLQRKGVEPSEVAAMIAPPAQLPLATSLQRLLQIAHEVGQGNVNDETVVSEVEAAVREAPQQRMLADLAVSLLVRVCRFDHARAVLERLAPNGEGSDGMVWLRVELALATGLDSEARALLPTTIEGKRAIRLAIRTRLYDGRLDHVRSLIEQGSLSPEENRSLLAYLSSDSGDQPEPADPKQAIADDDQSLTLAAAALANHDSALALRLAQRLRGDARVTTRARWILAHALMSQGNRLEALREIEALRQRCPQFVAAHELLGRLYLEQGANRAAETALAEAIAVGSKAPSLLLAHARALAELKRLAEARQRYARAEAAGGSADDLALARAQIALAEGDPRACRDALTSSTAGGLADGLLHARCLAAAGQLAEAELVLLEAHRTMPKQPMPVLLLGLLLQQRGSPEAEQRLRQTLALAQGEPLYRRVASRAHLGLARLKTRRGRPTARSFAELSAAIRADATYAEPFVQLGRWRFQQGRVAEAQRALERAVELNEHHATALYLLAATQGRDPAAQKRTYQAFLSLEPKGKRAEAARDVLSRLP
jgi:tetratricopeptide (TPR) repeat protein